jgi:hypothetical protein
MSQTRVLPVEDNPDNLVQRSIAAGAIVCGFDSLEIHKNGLPYYGVNIGFDLE